MKKITIVSGIQLSDNPRVVKEAATLANAGYDVEVLCSILRASDLSRNSALAQQQSFRVCRIVDASRRDVVGRFKWQLQRVKRKCIRTVCRYSGIESVGQLGYVAKALLKTCLSAPADLYSIHNPEAMWVAAKLIHQGSTVSADIEDWYSEHHCPTDLMDIPLRLLRSTERTVLNGAVFSSTTSRALASALEEQYTCRAPIVLYNAFSLSERGSRVLPPRDRPVNEGRPRIGWVSQVIGPDRGLDDLVAATHFVRHPIEIHLTGRLQSGMEQSLRDGLHPSSALFIQDQLPHEQLLPMMQSYDLGFAGELANSRNHDLTVSNKILHYFLAGVPAIASDTQGQLEISRMAPEATRIYSQRDPQSLAMAIDSLLESRDALNRAKQAAWDAGSTQFCWEANESRLLAAVCSAIGPPH